MITIIKFDVFNLNNQSGVLPFFKDNNINFFSESDVANNTIQYSIQFDLLEIKQMCLVKNYIIDNDVTGVQIHKDNIVNEIIYSNLLCIHVFYKLFESITFN